MLFKLAFKNMRKSIKDYSIYFFTLVFSVAIFYIFNSLDSQKAVLNLMGCKDNMIQSLIEMLSIVSVLVSVILGFLIIYSNNFLIKRRKKEIGLYLTLGMSKRKVSKILVIETVFIGIISLGVGLLLGVGLSQLLSVLTIKLFSADMSEFSIVFSQTSLIKTIVYFAIIFLLVMIFNVIILNKYKLIDLLTASKKNEKVRIKNKYITFIIFAAAIGILAYAYYLLFHGALQELNYKFGLMLATGCIGTFLFFLSLSGFLLRIVEFNKKLYYKGLNMFVLKQVNSKVNTTVFSTTVISIMLLFTIGILACSLSLATVFNSGLDENNLADFTLNGKYLRYVYDENENIVTKDEQVDLNKIKNSDEFRKDVKEFREIDCYKFDNVTATQLLSVNAKDKLIKEYGEQMADTNSPIIVYKKSQFDELMKLYNKKDMIKDINQDSYMLVANVDMCKEYYEIDINNGKELEINGHKCTILDNKVYDSAIENYNGDYNTGVVVVNDDVLNGVEKNSTTIIGNYIDGNKEEFDKNLKKYIGSQNEDRTNMFRTKIQMEDSSKGVKVLVTFIGLYLGIIFALTSATIIAIQQLSESSDNIERYRVLREIGADQKMINKSLFNQIAICFMIPLSVAIFHAYFGLKQTSKLLQTLGNLKLGTNILITSAFIILIYGGYFLATYLCSKRMVSED